MGDLPMEVCEAAGMQYLVRPALEGVAGEKAPVLLFLHGYDEGPPTDIRAGIARHGPLRHGSPAVTGRFLVVAPQLPRRGDLWPMYADDTVSVLRQVLSSHDADPSRVYLTGFSFGGSGVFDLALHDPSLWAALWPVDPTRVPLEDPALPVWLSSGEASRHRRGGYMERLRLLPRELGGGDDRIYADDGLDHVGTATAAYRSPVVYQWLLSKRRS